MHRLVVFLLPVVGCYCSHEATTAVLPDAGSPDAMGNDGAEADGGPLPDAFVPIDTGVDALLESPCECHPRSPCETATCVDGACAFTPRPDGTLCGEGDSLCVSGACVLRGCGDGYLGGDEECDDGNDDPDDACDACAARAFGVDEGPGVSLLAKGLPVAAASEGEVLVVLRRELEGSEVIEAHRFDRRGVFLGRSDIGAYFVGEVRSVHVAGTEGGWLVGWISGGEGGAHLRFVDHAGVLGPRQDVHRGAGLARELQVGARHALLTYTLPGELTPVLEMDGIRPRGERTGMPMRLASDVQRIRLQEHPHGERVFVGGIDTESRDLLLIRTDAAIARIEGPVSEYELDATAEEVVAIAVVAGRRVRISGGWRGSLVREEFDEPAEHVRLALSLERETHLWRDEDGWILQTESEVPDALRDALSTPRGIDRLWVLHDDEATWLLWNENGLSPGERDVRGFIFYAR
ncbi:MAG: hypothetical protein AAGE52_34200 [Myxococcota bacterium]